jgi:hypothetical protein
MAQQLITESWQDEKCEFTVFYVQCQATGNFKQDHDVKCFPVHKWPFWQSGGALEGGEGGRKGCGWEAVAVALVGGW